MSFTENITEKAGRWVLEGFEGLSRGFHAVPNRDVNPIKELPSQHRLLNVIGMVAGYSAVKYLADIAYGHKINGAEYKEIKKEDVPAPLRFLHGVVKDNPFSDAPADQWKKVAHQLLPAVGGAFGAIKGSDIFFGNNGLKNTFETLMKKESLTALEAEQAISYAQGKVASILAGLSAWPASVTGLTGPLYGGFLNLSFLSRSNGRIGTPLLKEKLNNTLGELPMNAVKAADNILSRTGRFLEDAKTIGLEQASHNFGEEMTLNVFKRFLKNIKPEQEKQLQESVVDMFRQAHAASVETPEVKAKLNSLMKAALSSPKMQEYGGVVPGNAGLLGQGLEWLAGIFGNHSADEIRAKIVNGPLTAGRSV